MLPLVQMHQMVQHPIDFMAPHHGHLKPDYPSHHHGSHLSQPSQSFHNTDSTPRAFAIRSAQHAPALHRITTSFSRLHAHDQAEHSLRRKTPSGTIDNGYDGSLTHLASGPPPLKHMIVPASSKIFPTAVVQRAINPSAGSMLPQPPAVPWGYSAPAPAPEYDPGMDCMSRLARTPRGWGTGQANPTMDPGTGDRAGFLQQPIPQHSYHGVSGLQPLLGPGYQQSLSQTVHSPGGYQQPAIWRDGGLGYQAFIPVANNYTPQNSVDSAFMAYQSTMHHGFVNAPGLGQAHYFGLPLPSHPLDDGFSRYGPSHMAHHGAPGRHSMSTTPGAGYHAKTVTAGDASSPTRFRERALQSAHKSYSDLLLHLTSTKKAGHGRSGSGSRPASKMMVYPKPSTTPTGSGTKSRPLSAFADPTMAGYAQQMAQKEATARAFTNGHHQQFYHDMGSPILAARASLEMLSTLCEQSGWKWVEGMLLGGCLHYGLERYEEALEWFKRIVSLDPR